MNENNSIDPKKILTTATSILLVDWPSRSIPEKLLDAGFTVFCYSPNGYTKAEFVDDERNLRFVPASPPPYVDIVNVYRPEQEHEAIILKHSLPLKAKVIWLQPPLTSKHTRALAQKHNLIFIEGVDISEIAAQQNIIIKRTNTADKDFQVLISNLDHELWNELNEDQATYDKYNKVDQIDTAVVIYTDDQPAACGCFKKIGEETVEIKRMYVQKGFRGMGLSKKVLLELERWSMEKGYRFAILETSIHFKVAQQLYRTNGYDVIANYPPYVGLSESVCMKKELR